MIPVKTWEVSSRVTSGLCVVHLASRLCIAWCVSDTEDVVKFFKVNIVCRNSLVEVSGCSSGLHEHSSSQFSGDASLIARR